MSATTFRAAAAIVVTLSLFAAAGSADAAAPTSCGTKGSNREAKLGKGSGEDLLVVGSCAVSDPGTYKYANVNIVDGGTLTFKDESLHFWAKNIVVENGGALIAGSPTAPIGTKAGAKVTVHLYGADQNKPLGAVGVACWQRLCGIPETDVWNTDGATPVALPNMPTKEYFYQYGPMMYDGGMLSAEDTARQGTDQGFFGYKVLAVSYGGTLQLFGKKGATYDAAVDNDHAKSGTSWVRLQGSVTPTPADFQGAVKIVVDRDVVFADKDKAGASWAKGDRIVLTTTDYLPGHSEELEIVAIAADNRTITVKEKIKYRHQGEAYPLPADIGRLGLANSTSVETRAAVALLSRSIQIVSEGPDPVENGFPETQGTYFGGHTMVRQGFKVFQVQGVEFKQLGQGGRMMHYPVHFHMAQNTPKDTYVKDSSVNESMTRWMVLHATNGVTLARNVGWKSIGHGFYLEDGNEVDNTFRTNIGIFARAAIANDQNPRRVPGILAADRINFDDSVPFYTDVDHPTAFWIMNGWNDFEYNMAVGAGTCGTCYWLLPGANSGHSRHEPLVGNLKGYAALQAQKVVTTIPKLDNPLARAGLTPLRKFIGNSCSSAMNSLNTVGNAASCKGSGFENPFIPSVKNPFNLPAPCDQTNPPIFDANRNIIDFVPNACAKPAHAEADMYYPKVSGVRNATSCTPTAANNFCRTADPCDRGHLDTCAVTIIDRYISSFHMGTETNFGAMWLRGPGWFLVTDSVLTDAQNAGLSIVSGGGYAESDVMQGRWALVRKSVFVGSTQGPTPAGEKDYASPYGPFNPKGVAIVESQCSDNHCISPADGLTVPLDNFSNNQRMFNIYDGPTYQDSNAYLNIKRLPITDCSISTNGANCKSATAAGRVLGLPYDPSLKCYMPNAAIAWKQPNGFYYPPAFHSTNLYFGDVVKVAGQPDDWTRKVDIRHFVIEPVFKPNSYETKVDGPDGVKAKYCNWNPGMFNGYTDVDRQTELSDDDGSLTGYQNTISVNNDAFFNAPTEEVECESDNTAKTSPYDYVTSVVYPGCAMTGTCCPPGAKCEEPNDINWYWDLPCSNQDCYGVPISRQFLKGENEPTTYMKMAGQSTRQRSTLTPNNGKFYIDTTKSYATQKAAGPKTRINEFRQGDNYYLLLLYAKPDMPPDQKPPAVPGTTQTYQIYVGANFNKDDPAQLWATQVDVRGVPFQVHPAAWPETWTTEYDGNGVLTVTMNMNFAAFKTNYLAKFEELCQPGTFCQWTPSKTLPTGGTCGCKTDGLFADRCADASKAGANVCTAWAQKDVDCPKGGCYGIGFKMADMTYDVDKRPAPKPFPPGPPWYVTMKPALNGVAQSCTPPKGKSASLR